ncbi:MAG: thiamine-phosphate kinase [Gammaproteobacteria bacterium]|nr:thiamine-phosphate kinase [Gammaproteobacteria bacterium]MCP5201579.1 thiamine-phosphate kinase [Gammaproteobacteria bacterium]
MDEFDLIARYFAPLAARADDIVLGIGDDAALLRTPPGATLAVAVDTLVAGVHVPHDCAPAALGYRVAAVNLSDLAAMGARPRFATLALTLETAAAAWLEAFAAGLASALAPAGVALVGGDTTRGPLCVTLQLLGWAPEVPLRRDGARVGDHVLVSGTLGDARAALDLLGQAAADADQAWLLERYYRPTPRLALGQALAGLAHAAIDVSDGLVADLGHVARASGVAIDVELERLPLSPALRRHAGDGAARCAAAGGDDYELAFTVAAADRGRVIEQAAALGVTVTDVGRVVAGAGVRCRDADGRDQAAELAGYRHF